MGLAEPGDRRAGLPDRARFNLPGRFGFGRTAMDATYPQHTDAFQSARQIWVWPNLDAARQRIAWCFVSICQADLGLAEREFLHAKLGHRISFNLPGRFGFGRTPLERAPERKIQVSICQADLGLAERYFVARSARNRRCFNLPGRFGFGRTRVHLARMKRLLHVSICQADLGLAERRRWCFLLQHPFRFNLPGRFGFGRTANALFFIFCSPSFNLPGRFGFGRTTLELASHAARSPGFNLPGRFGFGRTEPVEAGAVEESFNLPGRFGFGRTKLHYPLHFDKALFQSARQIWVWPNTSSWSVFPASL